MLRVVSLKLKSMQEQQLVACVSTRFHRPNHMMRTKRKKNERKNKKTKSHNYRNSSSKLNIQELTEKNGLNNFNLFFAPKIKCFLKISFYEGQNMGVFSSSLPAF